MHHAWTGRGPPLNDALVFLLARPVLLWLTTQGVGALIGNASGIAHGWGLNPGQLPGTATGVAKKLTPAQAQQAADTAKTTAWGTLIGLVASAVGGTLGMRRATQAQRVSPPPKIGAAPRGRDTLQGVPSARGSGGGARDSVRQPTIHGQGARGHHRPPDAVDTRHALCRLVPCLSTQRGHGPPQGSVAPQVEREVVMASRTPQTAGQGMEQAHEKVGQAVDQAHEKTGQLVDAAKQQTTSRLEDQRERVATGLYTTAHALRQTGQQLREQEQAPLATLADKAAQQAERGSGYLRGRDVPQLLDETEQLGRAHPVLFTGGALALGLLGVRFLKSSRRRQPSTALVPRDPAAPIPVGMESDAYTAALVAGDADPLALALAADGAPVGTGAGDVEDAVWPTTGQDPSGA